MTQPASGERDLPTLLRTMQPVLCSADYVFAPITAAEIQQASCCWFALISEEEGMCAIMKKEHAEALLARSFCSTSLFAKITLNVHSSLHAVGLTAAVANKLAELSISANVIAGYYHDHIFVARNDGQRALDALTELARSGV